MFTQRFCAVVTLSLFCVASALGAEVKLSAQQQEAADKLKAKGASVLQIAADTEALSVNLSLAGKNSTDAELALVKALPKVQQLNAGGTAVTDAGLASLSGMTDLTHVHLDRTGVTDAGLAHLKGLSNLIYLNLYSTEVTDKGLDQLKGLKNLKRLYVWQTKVTEDGAKALKTALADVYVNRGIEQAAVVKVEEKKEEPKPAAPQPAAAAAAVEVKEAPAGAKPVNSVCPVSGKPVDVTATVLLFEGKNVGFCCTNCPNAFKADPKKFADKIKADVKPAEIAAAVKPEEKKLEAPKPAPVAAAAKPEEKKPEAPKPAPVAAAKPDEKKPEAPAPAAKPEEKKPVQVAAAVPVPKVEAPKAEAKPQAAAANVLKAPARRQSWRLEQHEGGKAIMLLTDGVLSVDVTSVGSQPWHVQLFNTGLDVDDGKTYTLTFSARADEPRPMTVQAGMDEEPWQMIGLEEDVVLTKDWKPYTLTFTASDTRPNDKNRIGFVLGMEKGKVYIKDPVMQVK